MSCLITSGLGKDACNFLIGGIKNIYIANHSDITAFVDSGADGIYDSVTMASSGVFYLYETSKNTSSYTQDLTVNGSNKYISQTVDFFVPRADNAARISAEKLALATVVVIVETRNGKKIVLGEENGLEATVGQISSGVAEGDNSALHFTLLGAELGYGHEFVGTIPV